MNYEIVDGVDKLKAAIGRVRDAQQIFSGYTQEGSYSDDELEALIKKSSVKVKGE